MYNIYIELSTTRIIYIGGWGAETNREIVSFVSLYQHLSLCINIRVFVSTSVSRQSQQCYRLTHVSRPGIPWAE